MLKKTVITSAVVSALLLLSPDIVVAGDKSGTHTQVCQPTRHVL